ncbi:MAG TPA: C1 family peptidase [Planctomycetota bacterium]|nr:C1 family peptidase [Planctomycetota bacterium]
MRNASTERDGLDFRDLLYRPTLAPLPARLAPRRSAIRVRDQGVEGACAGFGLAATIDYLAGLESKSTRLVSARMLYEMGKRHDRWPGSDYEGTSARGVMKGWHKNGVCRESQWPYREEQAGHLSRERAEAALQTPLGAYYRVLPRRPDVHAALVEVGAVFATAAVHPGWHAPRRGRIPWDPASATQDEGHAFAILGYTPEGFLVQNSWGTEWGGWVRGKQRYPGLALWSFADFDANVWDLWVARRARPVESLQALATGWLGEGPSGAQRAERTPSQLEIRDHNVHVDDGRFVGRGDYPTDAASLAQAWRGSLRTGRYQHVLLYAHGGLNSLKASARRVAQWKSVFEANGVLAVHFLWETGFCEEIHDLLLGKRASVAKRVQGRGEGWDRWIEARIGWAGRALWAEMKRDARRAFANPGSAGSQSLQSLARAWGALPTDHRPRLHLAGHSAGGIFLGHLLSALRRDTDLVCDQMMLLAPANNVRQYESTILPALQSRRLQALAVYLLDDASERQDTSLALYGKSLLYLVSRAFESKHAVEPLLGMARWMDSFSTDKVRSQVEFLTPQTHPALTMASSHTAFDNDVATMNSLLAKVLGAEPRVPFARTDLVD